jgi:transposase-like protein
MKLLNISNIKSAKNKTVIEEYDDDDDYVDDNIYSNKCAIFISKSDEDALENIKNAYEEIFPLSKDIKYSFAFTTNGSLEIRMVRPCEKCGSTNIIYKYLIKSSRHGYVCEDCKKELPDDYKPATKNIPTITIYNYIKEQLLIIELYNKYMEPYPDNIMMLKYLIKNKS